jgi:hypothetical protein
MTTHTSRQTADGQLDHAMAIDAHDRTAEALAGNPGGLNAPAIAVVGLVGVILVYVIAVATQAWFYSQGNRHDELELYATPNAAMQQYRAEQKAKLNELIWADHDKTMLSIPIDKAAEAYATDPAFRAHAGPSK